MMSLSFLKSIAALTLMLGIVLPNLNGQTTPASPRSEASKPKPEETEVWSPEPKVVTPGATCGAPSSDAIILFDGKNLDEWVSADDHTPAKWLVGDGIMTVNKST